jgi:hypothetical protein
MKHIVLLGDSVFDNAKYVDTDLDVEHQLKQILPQGFKVTRLALDGDMIHNIKDQLRGLPSDATHLVVSAGGNDALSKDAVLELPAWSVADALTQLAEIGDGFGSEYGSMLNEVSRVGLPTGVCTIYGPPLQDDRRAPLASRRLPRCRPTL